MRVAGFQVAGRGAADRTAVSRSPLIASEAGPRHADWRARSRTLDRPPSLTPDIAFLARRGIPLHVLNLAASLAARRGTEPSRELFAIGFDPNRYWALLAQDLGLNFVANLDDARLPNRLGFVTAEAVRLASYVLVEIGGRSVVAMAPRTDEIALLAARLKQTPSLKDRILIAAPETIRGFLLARRKTALTHYAVNRLAQVMPRFSARDLGAEEAMRGRATLLAAALALVMLAPAAATQTLLFLGTMFFFNCSFWKLAAAFSPLRPLRLEAVPTARLPSYTVLVPLYREAAVVPDLVRHLAAMDYPALCIKRTKGRKAGCGRELAYHGSPSLLHCPLHRRPGHRRRARPYFPRIRIESGYTAERQRCLCIEFRQTPK